MHDDVPFLIKQDKLNASEADNQILSAGSCQNAVSQMLLPAAPNGFLVFQLWSFLVIYLFPRNLQMPSTRLPIVFHLSHNCFPVVVQMWSPNCLPKLFSTIPSALPELVFQFSPNAIFNLSASRQALRLSCRSFHCFSISVRLSVATQNCLPGAAHNYFPISFNFFICFLVASEMCSSKCLFACFPLRLSLYASFCPLSCLSSLLSFHLSLILAGGVRLLGSVSPLVSLYLFPRCLGASGSADIFSLLSLVSVHSSESTVVLGCKAAFRHMRRINILSKCFRGHPIPGVFGRKGANLKLKQ